MKRSEFEGLVQAQVQVVATIIGILEARGICTREEFADCLSEQEASPAAAMIIGAIKEGARYRPRSPELTLIKGGDPVEE